MECVGFADNGVACKTVARQKYQAEVVLAEHDRAAREACVYTLQILAARFVRSMLKVRKRYCEVCKVSQQSLEAGQGWT